MKFQFFLALVMASAAATTLFGQDTDAEPPPPVPELATEDIPELESEDIPPPEPVPYTPEEPEEVDEPNPAAESNEDFAASNEAPAVAPRHVGGGEFRIHGFGTSLIAVEDGFLVRGVIVGSPAQAAGVKPNDTIVSVNGNSVGDGHALQGGNVTTVGVVRNGQSLELRTGSQQFRTQRPAASSASATYSVPRTVISTPPSYRAAPPTGYRTDPRYSYPAVPYSYRSYSARPSVRIGIGYGSGYPGGRYGYGPYGYGRPGFSPYRSGPYGYGRGGYGPMYYGRGRSGVGITFGGIGIRF